MNSQNSGENSDTLVPQPHGGALLPGGKRGNAGGGRPRDVIRASYLDLLSSEGVAFLRDVIRGQVAVRLRQTCEHCGKEPTYREPTTMDAALELKPSTEARLRAIDIASRYALGGRDEITVVSSDVQERLARQAKALEEICPPELWKTLYTTLSEVWS